MDVELDLPLLVRSNRSVLRIVGVVLTEFKTRGASDSECSCMLSRKTPMICISEFAEAYSNVAYINEVRLPVRGGGLSHRPPCPNAADAATRHPATLRMDLSLLMAPRSYQSWWRRCQVA